MSELSFKDQYIGELERLSNHLLNRLRDEYWKEPRSLQSTPPWEHIGISEIEYKKWLNDPDFYIPVLPEDSTIGLVKLDTSMLGKDD